MDPQKHKDNPEYTDMRLAHRRTEIALTIISILLAAAFIGVGMYGVIHSLLGVAQCQ